MHYEMKFLVAFVTGMISDYWFGFCKNNNDENYQYFLQGAIDHTIKYLNGYDIYGATPDIYCVTASEAARLFGRKKRHLGDLALATLCQEHINTWAQRRERAIINPHSI